MFHNSYGTLVSTIKVDEKVPPNIVGHLLIRHFNNDWGDLCDEDAQQNRLHFEEKNGGTIHSVYKKAHEGETLWVITVGYGNDPKNPDMCNTTVLYPEEY